MAFALGIHGREEDRLASGLGSGTCTHPTPSTGQVNDKVPPTSRWCGHGPFLHTWGCLKKILCQVIQPPSLTEVIWLNMPLHIPVNMYWPVDNVIWTWNFGFECPINHIYMCHTAHVIFVVKRDLVFFPSPLLKWKQLKRVDWVSRAWCKVLSERKQMSFHPFSGGEMSGTITGATYGNRQEHFSSDFECLD